MVHRPDLCEGQRCLAVCVPGRRSARPGHRRARLRPPRRRAARRLFRRVLDTLSGASEPHPNTERSLIWAANIRRGPKWASMGLAQDEYVGVKHGSTRWRADQARMCRPLYAETCPLSASTLSRRLVRPVPRSGPAPPTPSSSIDRSRRTGHAGNRSRDPRGVLTSADIAVLCHIPGALTSASALLYSYRRLCKSEHLSSMNSN